MRIFRTKCPSCNNPIQVDRENMNDNCPYCNYRYKQNDFTIAEEQEDTSTGTKDKSQCSDNYYPEEEEQLGPIIYDNSLDSYLWPCSSEKIDGYLVEVIMDESGKKIVIESDFQSENIYKLDLERLYAKIKRRNEYLVDTKQIEIYISVRTCKDKNSKKNTNFGLRMNSDKIIVQLPKPKNVVAEPKFSLFSVDPLFSFDPGRIIFAVTMLIATVLISFLFFSYLSLTDFSKSSAVLTEILTEMHEQKSRGHEAIGINVNIKMTQEQDTSTVMITSINENGIAYEQGLAVGDIIKKINGHEIKTNEDMLSAMSDHYIGEPYVFEVMRNGNLETENIVTVLIQTEKNDKTSEVPDLSSYFDDLSNAKTE